MSITTMTSRQFNQEVGRAKKAAREGPVFVTDRGEPSHVLLSFAEYQNLARSKKNIGELLAMDPQYADIELELPDRTQLFVPWDFEKDE